MDKPKANPEEAKKGSSKTQKELNKQKIQNTKEQSLRDVLGFYINQVDEKKFLKKKPKMKKEVKRIVGGEILEQEEITQDEFLNQNEFAEIKGNYDDLGLGDLALVFPNPDMKQPNQAVTFKQAEQHFDEVLTVMTDEGVSKAQMKKERDSFLLAFLTLEEYDPEKEEKEKETNEKKNKNSKKQDKKEGKGNIEKSKKGKDEKKKLNEKKYELQTSIKEEINEGKEQNKTSYQKYLDIQKIIKQNNEEQKLREHKQKVLEDKKDNAAFEEAYLGDAVKEVKQAQFAYIDPIKELLKIHLTDVNQFNKVKKSWSCGGFLQKKVYEDGSDYDWVCSNSPPKDYLTLIRFTVMAKLCRNGCLHTRTFVSGDGEAIFMVIKSNRAVIMRQAEAMKITKQLELGYADLFSLEPVDESFRPLRLKNYVRDYQTDDNVKKLLDQVQQHEEELRQDESDHDKSKRSNVEEGTIEERGKLIYQRVMKWKDLELRVNIIKKQAEIDKHMKKMSKDLNIDMSHEKVELIDDKEIGREEWETYYVYMEYICDFMEKLAKLEDYPEIQHNQAFLYKLIFRKAVGDANEFWQEYHSNVLRTLMGQENILFTLWDRLQVPPIPPFADYFNPNTESGSSMWRKYEVNERGLRSEFINMEKIKITHAIVLKTINVLKLIQLKMAVAYFPIHDPYQLKGIVKEPFFKTLLSAGLMNEQTFTAGERELKKLFQAMQDEAESTDFDADSLEDEAKFNPRIPWLIPTDTMRDYFGEKIALYFDFLSFYTKQLWYMAIIGIIAQALISGSSQEARNSMITLFSIVIIVWSTFFIEFWKREQVIFSVQFGQQNFEEDEAERPAFEGQYVRSITNDDLNEEFYSPFFRKMKMLLSLAVSFVIIGMVIACVIGIFILKNYLNTCKCVSNRLVIDQVPAILNSVQIQIFNIIYYELGMRFNNFENHKILSSYENSLIAKIFIFMFVNTFNSFFIIAFMNSYFATLGLCDIAVGVKDCFQILQTQMTTIFLVTFFKNIPELATPLLLAVVKKRSRTVDEKPVVHPFNLIDSFIEEQLDLEPYATNEEVDGTVNDYMELVIQFSFLALFGLAFPISFLLAFITDVAEIQVDKVKLTKLSRRPFPQGASNIGNWLVILEVITFFGIFSNAGLIVYTSDSVKGDRIVTFSILLVVFLGTKYFIRFIIPDAPESAMILNKRHQYAVDRVVKHQGFAKSRTKSYKPARINLNIGGVAYDEKQIEKIDSKNEMEEDEVKEND